LLDVSMQGAKRVLFNVSGDNLTLYEVNNAADVIRQAVDPNANVIFGVIMDPNLGNDVRLTMIATGFITQEAMTSASNERELARLLKGIGEDELDMPSYLRQHKVFSTQKPAAVNKNYN
jgi:cell division protein FtsZ